MQYTGMPVRVGIGPTKTLAKVASYGAKRYPATRGVLDVTESCKRTKLMKLMPVNEIWGVGRRLNKRLLSQRVSTAFDLSQMDTGQIRKQFSIMLVNTIRELRGETCIPLDNAPTPKKQNVTEDYYLHYCINSSSFVKKNVPRGFSVQFYVLPSEFVPTNEYLYNS